MVTLADRVLIRQIENCPSGKSQITPLAPRPSTVSPAAIYLASLSPASAATMRQTLGVLSRTLGHPDILTCP